MGRLMKKRAYIAANFEPEYFEPGTLVVLDPLVWDPLVWDPSSPGILGLIISRDEKPSSDPIYGSQYNHRVLVGEHIYNASRISFVRKH
jgi:hypothetical protein